MRPKAELRTESVGLAVAGPAASTAPDATAADAVRAATSVMSATFMSVPSRERDGRYARGMEGARASAVVVPGHSSRGRVSRRCLRLVDAAAAVAEREGAGTVVFTGAARTGVNEAEQMRRAWPGSAHVELVV